MDITILVTLLIFSAFFSGSETAFFSLGKIRAKQIENLKTPLSRRIVSLLSDPHKLIITILIGNTFVNIAASSITAGLFYEKLGEKGVIVSIIAMTGIILVFGEVTPKMFALSHARNFSFFASLPLVFFEKVFTPVRYILRNASELIVKGVGIKIQSERPRITKQDIQILFSIGKKRGVVKKKENDMIENILTLKDLNAADIMTPRINVAAIDLTSGNDEIVGKIKETQYSRLPVYIHDLDNIAGVIHAKDFLLAPDTPIKNITRKPYFVPESMRADDLLKELQRLSVHMAIVTDEYGVTSGLITIEDILEEIVGEIRDEHDFEKPNIRKIDQNTYEASGQVHINDINEKLGLNIDTDEVDTIGGFIMLKLGRMPKGGDTVQVNSYLMTVGDVSKNRITNLKIEKKKTR